MVMFFVGLGVGVVLTITMAATGWWVPILGVLSLGLIVMARLLTIPLVRVGLLSQERADRIVWFFNFMGFGGIA